MDSVPVSVGIDVSKDQLDVAVGSAGNTWSVRNDEAGIRELLTTLEERRCALVVLEATTAAGRIATRSRPPFPSRMTISPRSNERS